MELLLQILNYALFGILVISFILLILGLIKPIFIQRIFRLKKKIGRGKILLIFGLICLAIPFLGAKITKSDKKLNNKTNIINIPQCNLKDLTGNCGPFSKDENHVYYQDRNSKKTISSADPITFTLIINKWSKNPDGSYNWDKIYSKDKNNVYYEFTALEGADPNTFKQIGNGEEYPNCSSNIEGKDKIYVYSSWSRVMGNPDISTYEVIGCGYSKDKKNLYFSGNACLNFDTKTFQIIDPYFAKNKEGVYVSGCNLIPEADPGSFVSLGNGKAKDKNKSYDVSEIYKELR